MNLRAILVIAALCLPAFDAVADEAEPVIVLVAGKDSAFASRVSAELESIGFRVVTEVDPNASPPERTVAVARIIDGADRRIEVTPSADLAGTNDVPIVIEAGSADNVSSVQVSERIRAYFQPLHERVAPPAIAPPPPPPAPPRVDPPPRVVPREPPPAPPAPGDASPSWSAGIGAGLSIPFDTGGVGLGALVSFYALPVRWLRLAPFLAAPLVATRVEGKGGSASLYTGTLGATVDFGLVENHSIGLFAGAGFGGVWLRAVGHPQPGFTGSTADTFFSTALAEVALRVRLNESLWLVPGARLGVGIPPAAIQFNGQTSAHWGLPWGALSISLEWDVVH